METNGMHARKLIALGALTLALSVPVALADTVDEPADDAGAQQTTPSTGSTGGQSRFPFFGFGYGG